MKAEDPPHLSTDPSPYHWTLKSASAVSPEDLLWATRENTAMIQVQKCGDVQTNRKKILSKNPKICHRLLIPVWIEALTLWTTFIVNPFILSSILLMRLRLVINLKANNSSKYIICSWSWSCTISSFLLHRSRGKSMSADELSMNTSSGSDTSPSSNKVNLDAPNPSTFVLLLPHSWNC